MEEIGDHQLRLVVYPIIYREIYIPGAQPDFWTINSSSSESPSESSEYSLSSNFCCECSRMDSQN